MGDRSVSGSRGCEGDRRHLRTTRKERIGGASVTAIAALQDSLGRVESRLFPLARAFRGRLVHRLNPHGMSVGELYARCLILGMEQTIGNKSVLEIIRVVVGDGGKGLRHIHEAGGGRLPDNVNL